MFSVVCVCHSAYPLGSPCDHYPWCLGPHCAGPSPPWTSVVGPPAHPALAPAPYYWHLVANNWRPVQTCSLEDPSSALSNLCSVLNNSSTILSLIPPYPERSYVRTLNGNSITHSHSSGWLLFKVPQHTRKTSLFRDTWHYQIMLSIHLAIGIHRVRIIYMYLISLQKFQFYEVSGCCFDQMNVLMKGLIIFQWGGFELFCWTYSWDYCDCFGLLCTLVSHRFALIGNNILFETNETDNSTKVGK